MFDFGGITHIIPNPKGHAPGFNFSLVGTVYTCMLEARTPTRADIMGGRVQKDGFAYHGRQWETVQQILDEAAKHAGIVKMCDLDGCACRKLFSRGKVVIPPPKPAVQLVHVETGRVIVPGETITDFRGEDWELVSVDAPTCEGKSGYVYVKRDDSGEMKYYPTVFACKIIPQEVA